MNKKLLNKTEIKVQTAEENIKKNKKRDFRKLANQLFKNPTDHLPLITSGFGKGEHAYCYYCKMIPYKVVVTIVNGDIIRTCKTCGYTDVEFRTANVSILDKIYWKYKEFKYGRQHKKVGNEQYEF